MSTEGQNSECSGSQDIRRKDMLRDLRNVREQWNKMLKDWKNENNKEERASGINPDPSTENELMLDEIAEAMESTIHTNLCTKCKQQKRWQEAEGSPCLQRY